ncbi:MAG: copper amine oxidase N-terminal domain-containing protein [Armatimonadetes bacterium]|jgi:hypothetical protein|nr:copper amine oxidase N-terminal domain-containing protein [Armatimonadota bacterium]
MTRALLVLLALGIAAAVLAADAPVKVYVDGKLQTYSPPAILRGGSVYVPLRAGAKSLGIDVKWIAASQTAQICTDQGCTLIPKSDGVIVNGSLLLPLRKMGEATGAKVSWDPAAKAVRIAKQG